MSIKGTEINTLGLFKNYGQANKTVTTKVVLLHNIIKRQTLSKIVL